MHSFMPGGWNRSTKTVEFLAHMMAHQAKVLTAKPDKSEAWSLLGGRKEPTPVNCPLSFTPIPWNEHTHIPAQ